MARSTPRVLMQRLISRTIDLAATDGETEMAAAILLEVNQLAGLSGASRSHRDAEQVLNALLQRLTELVSRRPAQGDYARQMVEDLNEWAASTGLWQGAAPEREADRPRTAAAHSSATYHIRHGSRGVRLVEHREGSRKDFYIPQHDFDIAIEAISQVAAPEATFERIHERFCALGGSDVASAYPLRLVLRFLRSRQPPLLTGQRRRYRLTLQPEQLRQAAQQAWAALPRQ